MRVELNLWIQPTGTYRAQLNIERGAFRKSFGALKSIDKFCAEGLKKGNITQPQLDAWLASIPDPDALYAWTEVRCAEDFIAYNPKQAYAKAFIDAEEFHLPLNKIYKQQYKHSPDISFRN